MPGLTLKAGLRMTTASIDLIRDVDMHLFVEAGMRGGVSCVSKRLAEASDEPDEEGYRQFLLYLDANNLYVWAMSQYLPTGEYRWLSDDEVAAFQLDAWAENGAKGCLLEVDLDFPDELHDLLVDYPPAPEKKPITYEMTLDCCRYCITMAVPVRSVGRFLPNSTALFLCDMQVFASPLYIC